MQWVGIRGLLLKLLTSNYTQTYSKVFYSFRAFRFTKPKLNSMVCVRERTIPTMKQICHLWIYITNPHTVPGIHQDKQRQKKKVDNDAPWLHRQSDTVHELVAMSTDHVITEWPMRLKHLVYLSYQCMSHPINATDSKSLFLNINGTCLTSPHYYKL
jgi:hypothetical protein